MVLRDGSGRGARARSEEPSQALARSKGFTVESPIGQLGTVEAVRYSVRPRRPHLLVVRVGGAGQRLVLVPASSVEKVVREAGRIVLRPGILLRRFGVHAPRPRAAAVDERGARNEVADQ